LHVYGDGFLQTVYRTKFNELTEQQKYQTMWLYDAYREVSPGEGIADTFIEQFEPKGDIIDFGCGTGRSSLKFEAAGLNPILVDFADNARDQEALHLPFIVHDLSQPMTIYAENGYCTDVMEHIPTHDVETVVRNIMSASEKVFFQISTVDDHFGAVFNEPLHLTVKPHKWWLKMFKRLGYKIHYNANLGNASIFYIANRSRKKAA
jgi:SAM-dependent methyltransferase